jgi:hypothetical protein
MHPLKLLLNIYNIFQIYIYRLVNNQSYEMLDRQIMWGYCTYKYMYHAKSESSFLMAAIVTINAINEINRELTLTVSLFLLIFCNVTLLD